MTEYKLEDLREEFNKLDEEGKLNYITDILDSIIDNEHLDNKDLNTFLTENDDYLETIFNERS